MLNLHQLINDFWQFTVANDLELYNEFSLQHELGIFLRNRLSGYKIQFERNVSYFGIYGNVTIKKEIDITIFNHEKTELYAIELKYPRNGQYPEQMYAFTKDILFMEQLKENGFTQTCAVALVEERPYYEGSQADGIYQYFRGGVPVSGTIYKPTGMTKGIEHIDINGSYKIEWHEQDKKRKYYIVSI